MDDTLQSRPWYSRRRFLKVASLGIGVAAVFAWSLKGIPGMKLLTRNGSTEFPGEGSIFHPRRDPRQLAKERKNNQT